MENKLSLMQSRMWQLQPLVLDIQIVRIEKVDVDLARNIASVFTIPSERFFDSNHFLQEIGRITVVFDFHDRVEKFSRARFAIDGLSLINR